MNQQKQPEIILSSPNDTKSISSGICLTAQNKLDKLQMFSTPECKKATKQLFPNTDVLTQKTKIYNNPSSSHQNNNNSATSPYKELISDRFIPIRSQSIARNLFEVPNETFISPNKIEPFTEEAQNHIKYNSLLENQLLDVKHTDFFSRFASNSGAKININAIAFGGNGHPHNHQQQHHHQHHHHHQQQHSHHHQQHQQHQQTQSQQLSSFSPRNNLNDTGLIMSNNGSLTNDKAKMTNAFQTNILPTKLLKFKTPLRENHQSNILRSSPFMEMEENEKAIFETFKPYRKISKIPYKILDAPSLQDDFYLNLINWSSKNQLAVSLGQAVWVWNGDTCEVYRFAYKNDNDEYEEYTSVEWDPKGNLLAVGDYDGKLEIWDVNVQKKIRTFQGHTDRIDCLSWNGNNIISTGSRDKTILTCELRSPSGYVLKYDDHKDEVCGLKWSYNGQQLASGSNDNNIFIWNLRKNEPEARFKEHTSAVKALTWSPHQQGLLLSGGGYTDRSIKIWNTLSMTLINSIQTESQICNMLFSKNSNEFVTTHGLPGNQIMIWKYPELLKICVLDGTQGHSERVLYLSDSPNGENIVTGASDETLKFWKIFPGKITTEQSHLYPSMQELR